MGLFAKGRCIIPRIELIPEVFYGPNDPIHWEYDNLPLKAIIERQNIINAALDNVINDLTDAIGTQGTLGNRLSQSLNDDGSLKTEAIDLAMHTMDDHTDTDNFVRMTKLQSDKIDLVQDEANNLVTNVYTDDTTFAAFNTGEVNFRPSSTIVPHVSTPNNVSFNLAFSSDAIHRHYYGLVPVSVNQIIPNYTNYQVDSISSPFVEGSLRIFINGVRIFEDGSVYVPGALVTDQWTLMLFTEDSANGLFELSAAITQEDIIRIDFDISLA